LVPVEGQQESMCIYDAEELAFSSLCLKFPTVLEEELVAFQLHVTGLRTLNQYVLSLLENADEAQMYFDMPSNDMVNFMWTHPVVVATRGNSNI